jgi:hypothetical protein
MELDELHEGVSQSPATVRNLEDERGLSGTLKPSPNKDAQPPYEWEA